MPRKVLWTLDNWALILKSIMIVGCLMTHLYIKNGSSLGGSLLNLEEEVLLVENSSLEDMPAGLFIRRQEECRALWFSKVKRGSAWGPMSGFQS